MTRWHLIDEASGPAVAARVAAAAGEPALVIGDGRLATLVRSAGVRYGEYVSAPLRRTTLARSGAQHAVRRHRITSCVAWSAATAKLAAQLKGVAFTKASASDAPPVWRLNNEPSRDDHRTGMRAAWDVDDDIACILALGGDEVTGDAYDAAMAVGLAREARLATGGRDTRLVVRPSQPGRPHAEALWRDFGLRRLLIAEPRAVEPWAILPAVDAVLDLGPQPTAWRQWIDDLDLPIVGPKWLPSRHGRVADVRQLAGGLEQAISR